MKPSAEEIALRVDAVAPVLAANAEACVNARSVVPGEHASDGRGGITALRHPIVKFS
jgi:hypothetical protein